MGIETAFQLNDRAALSLQAIAGLIQGFEGSLRYRYYPLAARRHAMYVAVGPNLVSGITDAPSISESVSSLGPIGALGWEYRGDSGFTFALEASAAYLPSEHRLLEAASEGPLHFGGAMRVGLSR